MHSVFLSLSNFYTTLSSDTRTAGFVRGVEVPVICTARRVRQSLLAPPPPHPRPLHLGRVEEVVPAAGGERQSEEHGAPLDERLPRPADHPERHRREEAHDYQAGPDAAVDPPGPRGTPPVEHRAPQHRSVPPQRREQRRNRKDAPEVPERGAPAGRRVRPV